MTTDHTKLLQIAQEVTDEAKEIFLREPPGDYTPKGDRDFATEVDFAIERIVRERLARLTPDIGFVGEEYGGDQDAERYWCLDPIDGTINYAAGSPLCAISLALIEDGQPTIGIIDAPRLGDRYVAQQRSGAERNGRRVTTRQTTSLANTILSFGDFAADTDCNSRYVEQRDLLGTLAPHVLRVRMLGTAAVDLAWLADGRHSGTVIIGGNIWDTAAGLVIAHEAGAAVVSSPFKGANRVVACASSIRQQLSELIDSVADIN